VAYITTAHADPAMRRRVFVLKPRSHRVRRRASTCVLTVLTASVDGRLRASTRVDGRTRTPRSSCTCICKCTLASFMTFHDEYPIPIVTTMLYFCRTIFCKEGNADVVRDGIGFIGQSCHVRNLESTIN